MHTPPAVPAPHAPATPLDPRRKRILFRATHRGTHENDLMIGGWLAPRLPGMAEADLSAVESLLELPDPDLADWLAGRRPIPPGPDSPLLHRMRADILGPPDRPNDEPTEAA